MSNLSAALAAALQNHATIGSLVSGVISGRNFDIQDDKLDESPYSCISVIDLPITRKPYLGASDMEIFGQLEVRCVSNTSEDAAKELAEAVITYLGSLTSLTFNNSTLKFNLVNIYQVPDTFDAKDGWLEILTIDYI